MGRAGGGGRSGGGMRSSGGGGMRHSGGHSGGGSRSSFFRRKPGTQFGRQLWGPVFREPFFRLFRKWLFEQLERPGALWATPRASHKCKSCPYTPAFRLRKRLRWRVPGEHFAPGGRADHLVGGSVKLHRFGKNILRWKFRRNPDLHHSPGAAEQQFPRERGLVYGQPGLDSGPG